MRIKQSPWRVFMSSVRAREELIELARKFPRIRAAIRVARGAFALLLEMSSFES